MKRLRSVPAEWVIVALVLTAAIIVLFVLNEQLAPFNHAAQGAPIK